MKQVAFFNENGDLIRMQVKRQASDGEAFTLIGVGFAIIGFILL